MYEIAPYATFSVSCGRTTSELSKTPLRGVTPSALDYTVQFKTFGHPDGDNLNATAAYPVLPNAAFGHVKGKSSWQNQRYYNTDGNYHIFKFFNFQKCASDFFVYVSNHISVTLFRKHHEIKFQISHFTFQIH